MKKGCLIGLILVVLLGATGGWYYWKKTRENLSWVTSEVDRGPVRVFISASGSLAALNTVEVGTQISGIVASMSVDFNDRVRAGQLLAQIDPSTYEVRVLQEKAALVGAQAVTKELTAKLENLKAAILTSQAEQLVQKANVRKAEVALKDAIRDHKRTVELYARKLISQSDLDKTETARDSQMASVEGAKAQFQAALIKEKAVESQIRSVHAEMEAAAARISQNEATLKSAEINLDRTLIYSPIDGVVISREVDVGQTVAASLQAPKLFTIAQDLRMMQIDTAVDEADIGGVREGQKVEFTVDAYRDRVFEAHVKQVRLLPTTTSSVVTYSVMVNVANPDLLLKPGMTANVEILVDSRDDVLRVPSAAFFFRPPPEFQALLDKEPDGLKERETDTPGGKPRRQGKRGNRARTASEPRETSPRISEGADGEPTTDSPAPPAMEGALPTDPPRGRPRELGTIWVLEGETLKPVRVRMGISSQEYTEVFTGPPARDGALPTDPTQGTTQEATQGTAQETTQGHSREATSKTAREALRPGQKVVTGQSADGAGSGRGGRGNSSVRDVRRTMRRM